MPGTPRTLLTIALLAVPPLHAQTDTAAAITIGAVIDSYFAWDRNRPEPRDRALTTTAVRHNEFNVNLAQLSLGYAHHRVRARATLQAGTSVQANYAAEPPEGTVSGPSVARLLQEAYVGLAITPALSIDAGIFFSPIGHESWISLDNPTYTRSLTADYTPYYLSGVRGSWQASPRVLAQLQLVNGWQTIGERNEGKALVARVDVRSSERVHLAASGYLGDDQARGAGARLRQFGQLLAQVTPTRNTAAWITLDAGREDGRARTDATWWSATLIGQRRLTSALAVAVRAEHYADPRGVLIPLGDWRGPRVSGVSTGLDVRVSGGALWRVEARTLQADTRLFPAGAAARPTRDNVVLVTSLAWRAEQRLR